MSDLFFHNKLSLSHSDYIWKFSFKLIRLSMRYSSLHNISFISHLIISVIFLLILIIHCSQVAPGPSPGLDQDIRTVARFSLEEIFISSLIRTSSSMQDSGIFVCGGMRSHQVHVLFSYHFLIQFELLSFMYWNMTLMSLFRYLDLKMYLFITWL